MNNKDVKTGLKIQKQIPTSITSDLSTNKACIYFYRQQIFERLPTSRSHNVGKMAKAFIMNAKG